MIPESLIGYAIVSATSFSLGALFGWSVATKLTSLEQSELRRLMSVVMLGAYVVSLFADIQVSGYQTPMLLHGIMGGIFGYLFSQGDGFNITLGDSE